jgi:hypothetical protein
MNPSSRTDSSVAIRSRGTSRAQMIECELSDDQQTVSCSSGVYRKTSSTIDSDRNAVTKDKIVKPVERKAKSSRSSASPQ